jgi:hypothetical protein
LLNDAPHSTESGGNDALIGLLAGKFQGAEPVVQQTLVSLQVRYTAESASPAPSDFAVNLLVVLKWPCQGLLQVVDSMRLLERWAIGTSASK